MSAAFDARTRASRRSAGEAASRSSARYPAGADPPRRARAWPVLHGLFDPIGHFGVRRRTDDDIAVPPAWRRAADRARLRIRQRLPRYRKCRGDRHLYPRPAGPGRGGVVGVLEPPWRAGLDRRRRFRHCVAAAGRTHSPGRLGRRLRDGVCAAHRRDHLEPRHLVAWHSRLQLAYADRLDRRRRRRECAGARQGWHLGSGLGSSHQGRRGAVVLAAVRLCPLCDPAFDHEGGDPRAGALHRPNHQQAADVVDSRSSHAHVHPGFILSRLQRRPEGHGPDHADPDRRRADGLRAEPRPGRGSGGPVRRFGASRLEDRRSPRRWI